LNFNVGWEKVVCEKKMSKGEKRLVKREKEGGVNIKKRGWGGVKKKRHTGKNGFLPSKARGGLGVSRKRGAENYEKKRGIQKKKSECKSKKGGVQKGKVFNKLSCRPKGGKKKKQ